MKFGTRRSEVNLYGLKNKCEVSVRLQPIKSAGEQLMYHNCASLCSVCEVKEGSKKLTYHFFSCISGIETNMLLIVLLGLTAKLALVSGDCDPGTPTLHDFDYSRVGICVLTCLLKKAAVKIATRFYILFVVPLKNSK
jgi:hypothetical protein